jgi:hypothetical protein
MLSTSERRGVDHGRKLSDAGRTNSALSELCFLRYLVPAV